MSNEITEKLQRGGCLSFSQDDAVEHRKLAHKHLMEHPEHATLDIFTASCTGDVETVTRMLNSNKEAVNHTGGTFNWPPLLYACYSRFDLPGKSTRAVAQLLLANGADPNASFLSSDGYRFSALAGVVGVGEMGAELQPPHREWKTLARELLRSGAWPNDGQVVYHSLFNPSIESLELLFEFGFKDRDRGNWPVYMDELTFDEPLPMLQIPLYWSVFKGHQARARLLIEHGVHLTFDGDPTLPWRMAMLAGEPLLAAYMVELGSQSAELSAVEQLLSVCMQGDLDQAQLIVSDTPELIRKLLDEVPHALSQAAYAGNFNAVRALVELGADVNMIPPARSPLQQAALEGHLDVVQYLISKDADVRERDHAIGVSAISWASFRRHDQVTAFLSNCDVDIFDAILSHDKKRISTLVEQDKASLLLTLGELRTTPPLPDDWQTPLAYAVMRDDAELVRLLLNLGADRFINTKDDTTLVAAAKAANVSTTICTLLETG